MASTSIAEEKLEDLLRQIGEFRLKLDEEADRPRDEKRKALHDYISKRLDQITEAAIRAVKNGQS